MKLVKLTIDRLEISHRIEIIREQSICYRKLLDTARFADPFPIELIFQWQCKFVDLVENIPFADDKVIEKIEGELKELGRIAEIRIENSLSDEAKTVTKHLRGE